MTCRWSEEFFKNTEYTRHAQIIYKRKSSEKQTEQFKLRLHEFNCTETLALEDTNKAYDDLLNIFRHITMKVYLKLKLH